MHTFWLEGLKGTDHSEDQGKDGEDDINPLKSCGNYMYHLLKHSVILYFAHSMFMSFV
jgi:hypothetical protein